MKSNPKHSKTEVTKNSMNQNIVRLIVMAVFALNGATLFAQQQAALSSPSVSGPASANTTELVASADSAATHMDDALDSTGTSAPAESGGAAPKPAPSAGSPHKLGPLDFTVNWRFRTEAWDFFEPSKGQNAYAFEHSLLKIGIGQKFEAFEWLVEGAADGIFDLPPSAVQAAPLGQLGLGGTYFAANGNVRNTASGFLKQAYVGFKLPAKGNVRLGRFTFLDGAEIHPKDKTLATLISTRIAQRLIGDFSFSAVQRSFDGMQLGFDAGNSNFTFFGARPTEGVYQMRGMDELDINLFYGAFNLPITTKNNAGELRVFAIGYMDDRAGVLKTDNRSTAVRTADKGQIRIGTYGIDYVHVLHTDHAGQFDVLGWGAFQSGGWGVQTQQAEAAVGEIGWQPPVPVINPWFSAGYSYGSGDSNPNDNIHGTFFQIMPTPRPYDRFPFYNMMNNEDFYGSATFRLPRSFAVRSELHALRLANAKDLWYGGGGAFQSNTFGYTSRPSGGARSLANVWDVSLDVPLKYGFSITTYYGYAWGKSVIANIFPAGTGAQFGYVETNFRF
jgi:hypothetical protein